MSRQRTSPYEVVISYCSAAPLPEVENLLITVRAILKGRQPQAAGPRKRKAKEQASLPLEDKA